MTTTPLPFEREDSGPGEGVVTITLEQPERPFVVLDQAFLRRLSATLDAIGTDMKGLVIASASERVFVAGADLQEINSLSDKELDAYIEFGQQTLGRIASLPCTTVAAMNGAALGGGLELALHCDVLLGVNPPAGGKPYMIGLPEAGLGLCPGWGGTQTLPSRIDAQAAISMTCAGKPMSVGEALERGLLETLCESRDALLAEARKRAAAPKTRPAHARCIADADVREGVRTALDAVRASLPGTLASEGVVESIETGLSAGWQAGLNKERESLVRLRSTPAAQDALKAFFERSSRK